MREWPTKRPTRELVLWILAACCRQLHQNRDNQKGASRLCNLEVCSEAIRKVSLLRKQNSEGCKVWATLDVLEAARPCVKL